MDELRELSGSFFEEEIRPRLLQNLVDRMEIFQSEGTKVILLSGSLHFLLEELGHHLPVDSVLGCRLELKKGIITGRIEGIHPYGKDKILKLREFLNFNQIDFPRSWAFGDRWSDRYLLRLFGRCVVVNPRLQLKEWARERGCEIIQTER